MFFKDRAIAGKLLAEKLSVYKTENAVVYAIPRGGVITAYEIAKRFSAPLELIITRKIGHPYNPEYAIAAIAENGHLVGDEQELEEIDTHWLQKAIEEGRKEVKRRKNIYQTNKPSLSLTDKTVILVDDGIATGLTMQIAIKELQHRHPKKLIIAIPVIPQGTLRMLKREADGIVALDIPPDDTFLGAVGAYYEQFPPVEDREVISIITNYQNAPWEIKNIIKDFSP